MKFTREQFDKIGPFYQDDFCIDSSDQDIMFRLFNALPEHLQGMAIQWNCGNSVFRDEVFEYLCHVLYDMTPQEYYESDIFAEYKKGGFKDHPEIDWNKLEN